MFKRFQHPGWRALDALGLPVPKVKFDEFIALNKIDLKIKKGEKVALIGRNGAGKSTLLRVISGQMRPDEGHVTLLGNVQALMELGTGFHPDFSGIENIRSSLAYQGKSSTQVSLLIDEIIEFTELEDFINRPIREYSAGMYARLAFAVATAVTPNVLIIDEILGAGDAYFVGKSIQRMKNLTSHGATVIFVSHDMSAVQLLCERGVWIEQGVIKADGDILSVSKSYLASVREDEELRARAKSMALSKAMIATNGGGAEEVSIYRLIGCNGQAPRQKAVVAEVRFGCAEKTLGVIRADGNAGLSRLIVERGKTNWSNLETVDGLTCRNFGDFGGQFVHAPLQIDWVGVGTAGRWIEMYFRPSSSHALSFEVFDEAQQKYTRLMEIPKKKENVGWETLRIVLNNDVEKNAGTIILQTKDLQVLEPRDRYGTGPIKITGFGFFDQSGERRHTLVSGEPAHSVISYYAEAVVNDPVAVIAVYRYDGTCALQVTSNRENMKLLIIKGRGQISAFFVPLLLGPGDYIVSIALFKEMNLASRHEPEAYDLHDRCYTLKVLPPPGIGIDIGLVNQPAKWEICNEPG